MGAVAWNFGGLNLVDQLLELNWITIDLGEVCGVAESDILETMDLTETPKDVACVFALSFNTVDLTEIGLLRNALHHVFDELRLGKWVLVVHGHVIEQILLSRTSAFILEDAETTDKVV